MQFWCDALPLSYKTGLFLMRATLKSSRFIGRAGGEGLSEGEGEFWGRGRNKRGLVCVYTRTNDGRPSLRMFGYGNRGIR